MLALTGLAFVLASYEGRYYLGLTEPIPEKDARQYLTWNGRALNGRAVGLLKDHFSNLREWQSFGPRLDRIAAQDAVRIVALGTSHGFPGIRALLADSLDILKRHGYTALFVEVSRADQPYLEAYAARSISYAELRDHIRYIESDLDENVLGRARELGFTIIAMDAADKNEEDRDLAMFMATASYLDAHPGAKVLAVAGGHHTARLWYHAPERYRTFTARLRERYGESVISISIETASRANRIIRDAHDGLVPHGMMIRTSGTPVAPIPCWIQGNSHRLQYPGWEHTMRYGDWDYLAFEFDVPPTSPSVSAK